MPLSTTPSTDLASEQLATLGAVPGTLSPEQCEALDRDGFLVLPGLIDGAWRAGLIAAFDEILAREAREGQDHHFYDLVNEAAVFDRIWSHPQVLAAMRVIFARPFKLSSLNCREPRPGQGVQALHQDWKDGRRGAEPFAVANSLWLLDDFTAENGATRIVPGSQRMDGAMLMQIKDRMAPYPGERLLLAPAGTVVVFNAHAWHGGTLNRGGGRRRALHAYYTAREHQQQLDQRAHVRLATWRRLSRAQRWLLDVPFDADEA